MPLQRSGFFDHFEGFDNIADNGIFYKKCKSVRFSDAFATRSDILNVQCHTIVFFKFAFHIYLYSVFLIFASSHRLKPSHSLVSLASSASLNVSILASILSAMDSATASIIQGFFGEPYSSSP
mgnify:CR=1 FL=1